MQPEVLVALALRGWPAVAVIVLAFIGAVVAAVAAVSFLCTLLRAAISGRNPRSAIRDPQS